MSDPKRAGSVSDRNKPARKRSKPPEHPAPAPKRYVCKEADSRISKGRPIAVRHFDIRHSNVRYSAVRFFSPPLSSIRLRRLGLGEDGQRHAGRPSRQQRLCGLVSRRARRRDIIHQQHVRPSQRFCLAGDEGAFDVFDPPRPRKSRLWRRVTATDQFIANRQAKLAGDCPGNHPGVITPARKSPSPVHRDRQHQVRPAQRHDRHAASRGTGILPVSSFALLTRPVSGRTHGRDAHATTARRLDGHRQQFTQPAAKHLLPPVFQIGNRRPKRLSIRPQPHQPRKMICDGRACPAAIGPCRRILAQRRPAPRAIPHRHQRQEPQVALPAQSLRRRGCRRARAADAGNQQLAHAPSRSP